MSPVSLPDSIGGQFNSPVGKGLTNESIDTKVNADSRTDPARSRCRTLHTLGCSPATALHQALEALVPVPGIRGGPCENPLHRDVRSAPPHSPGRNDVGGSCRVGSGGGRGRCARVPHRAHQPTPDALAKEIERTRRLTDEPFGCQSHSSAVDLAAAVRGVRQVIIDPPDRDRGDAGANPVEHLPHFKDAGVKVIHSAPVCGTHSEKRCARRMATRSFSTTSP